MIVLDTHALIWWVSDPDRLGAKARRIIDREVEAGETLRVSAISAWEIAMLTSASRLELTMDVESWLARIEALPALEFIPVDNRIAVRAVTLEDFPHRDPADRIIVATALGLGATLATADDRIRSWPSIATVWK